MMEHTTTPISDTTSSQNGSRSASPRAPSHNGRRGILHEASATEHAAIPAYELDTLGFDPEAKAAELEDASAEEALEWALQTFNPRMYIACSFQKTSSVTVHMAHSINPDARFFYLDTDVLFPETYETKDRFEERYGINFHRYSSITLEQQKGLYGDELWSRDPDACCGIRKVEPMRSALAAVDLWVSGIRRSDSQTRAGAPKFAWDKRFGLWKLNPLADWSEEQVWSYIHEQDIPYNSAARPGLSVDRLHPLHPEAGGRRGRTSRALGGDGEDGVRTTWLSW